MRVASLDIGSSSVRAVVYGEDGEPEPGDAHTAYDDLDADRLVDACRAVLAQVGEADALAISCFWHSLVAVDARDRPLTTVLTWRDLAGGEPPQLDPADYHCRTGCFLHPAYWPAKILRLHADGARPARYFSFGDYLLLKLAGETRTSISTASGTGLYDPNRLAWDEETLAAVGVDAEQLPPVDDARLAGVFPALGDGACSNLGAGCTTRGRAAVMVGTSGALRVVYEADRAEPRPGLFLYRLDAQRFCEGGALSDGGNLHAWLLRTLRDLDEGGLAEREAAAHGLTFLPFLGGERSLGWDAGRRGLIAGLSFATTPLDVAQAALEAVCYRFAAVLEALGGVESVVVTGGALLANPAWTQVLADVLGRPLEVSAVGEASARGAAVAAFERLGVDLPAPGVDRTVEPRLERLEIHRAAMEEQEKVMRLEEAR
ncbi:MAG TPA: FGGY-family carbohydrate kinase [Gaiellaceae bacterium]|nr:FGGY-family carbohydrate kinase [Gaiellaceae bacterium]